MSYKLNETERKIRNILKKFQKALIRDKNLDAQKLLKGITDDFYVKFSNCKVIDYETNVIEKYGKQFDLETEFVHQHKLKTGEKLYFVDKDQLFEMFRAYLLEKTESLKLHLLTILPSSTRTSSKSNFIKEQKKFFETKKSDCEE